MAWVGEVGLRLRAEHLAELLELLAAADHVTAAVAPPGAPVVAVLTPAIRVHAVALLCTATPSRMRSQQAILNIQLQVLKM